jgi:23S rRNA pseudouridine955/2504/2580 synthase
MAHQLKKIMTEANHRAVAMPQKNIVIEVTDHEEGKRLDKVVKQFYPALTQALIEKSLRKGLIKIDGKKAASNSRLAVGQKITLYPALLDRDEDTVKPIKKAQIDPKRAKMLQDSVLYRDEDIIVLNKMGGLAVQGGSKINISLDDMLDCLSFGGAKPKLVHRLDKDTSGVLLLACNAKVATLLSTMFQEKNINKKYLAIVIGSPPEKEGKITSTMSKVQDEEGFEITANNRDGKIAISRYKLIATVKGNHHFPDAEYSLLELMPVTGRTHQLRVHCQSLGCPILGDHKYGIKGLGRGFGKLHLHAQKVTLYNFRDEVAEYTAPLPEHFIKTITQLGFKVKYD